MLRYCWLFLILGLWPPPSHASSLTADGISITTLNALPLQDAVHFATSTSISTGYALAVTGSAGNIVLESSTTASAFFGDGSNLKHAVPLAGTNTFSAGAVFISSFTIQSNGRAVILSTSSLSNNLQMNSNGAFNFYPEIHNSSSTEIPAATSSNSYCDVCLRGSTLTITTSGGRVEVSFTGQIYNSSTSASAQNRAALNFLQDGQYVADLSSSAVIRATTWAATRKPSISFRYLIDAPPDGPHSYCLSLCTNSAIPSTATLSNDSMNANIFFVKELK